MALTAFSLGHQTMAKTVIIPGTHKVSRAKPAKRIVHASYKEIVQIQWQMPSGQILVIDVTCPQYQLFKT